MTHLLAKAAPADPTIVPTIYQLAKACAFKVVAPNQDRGGTAGTKLMRGPGPHYRVAADCNCNKGKVRLGVRVYVPAGPYIYAQTVTGGNSTEPTWINAECGR